MTNSWSFFRFNSSDIYGRLKQGRRYNIVAAGWRFGLFSWYENIIKIREDLGPLPKGTPGSPAEPATEGNMGNVSYVKFAKRNLQAFEVEGVIHQTNIDKFHDRFAIRRMPGRSIPGAWLLGPPCPCHNGEDIVIEMRTMRTLEFPLPDREWENWAQAVFKHYIAHAWDGWISGDHDPSRRWRADLAKYSTWKKWCEIAASYHSNDDLRRAYLEDKLSRVPLWFERLGYETISTHRCACIPRCAPEQRMFDNDKEQDASLP